MNVSFHLADCCGPEEAFHSEELQGAEKHELERVHVQLPSSSQVSPHAPIHPDPTLPLPPLPHAIPGVAAGGEPGWSWATARRPHRGPRGGDPAREVDLDIALVGVGFPAAKVLDVVIEDACLLCPGGRSSAERVSGLVTRGVWGATGHPSSSQWRAETAQGDGSHVTGKGSRVSSMSWCAAHPSCMGFYVIVRCSSILRGVLCHCARQEPRPHTRDCQPGLTLPLPAHNPQPSTRLTLVPRTGHHSGRGQTSTSQHITRLWESVSGPGPGPRHLELLE